MRILCIGVRIMMSVDPCYVIPSWFPIQPASVSLGVLQSSLASHLPSKFLARVAQRKSRDLEIP